MLSGWRIPRMSGASTSFPADSCGNLELDLKTLTKDTPPLRLCLFTNTSSLIILIDCHKQYKVKDYQYPLVISGSNKSVGYQLHDCAIKRVLIGKIKTRDYCTYCHGPVCR